ncbi:putative palmitoyl-protein thioesterase precursor [Cryphonectria parasitica EP155]|uniref:Palmitoyl-protein thioesterase 1 n=1 Tax=Cryphonectria parasitica (strain ATCC 38755 / EP155) TaxID=660469 RepID=A0A9P4Y5N3_CRYP1|nr:putative palmitoyl-protein thioesterase precursor [Cryphonectria parasitica EP155]KAF3766960.1 putative palmitoyl-protein thioesterase precursor [Cryphonectria parasitica EP155]
MVLSRNVLTIGSLLASSVALPNPQQHRNDDDDNDTPLPLIIWHGLGDSYGNEGLQSVAALAQAVNPGTLVHIVSQGADPNADQRATFWGDVNDQIDKLCADIAANPIISTAPAVDALGFSQGGQFLRGWVERCNSPPVRNLVTFGSQHNGITEFSECAPTNFLCRGAMALLRGNVWGNYVQTNLVPAQYFRPPTDYDNYLENSNFLADINNEREEKSLEYKKQLTKLENFVMYMFEDDTTVIPKETSWWAEVNGTEVTPLRSRPIYQEDWLGLKELDRKGSLQFRTTPGQHMRLEESVLNDTFREFFGPLKSTKKAVSVDEL